MDDEVRLIKKIQSGQKKEFQHLISKYEKGCRTFFWQRCNGNLEVSRDLAQEAFIRVFRNINSLTQPEGFKAWFWTICRNVLIDYQRKEKCEQKLTRANFQDKTTSPEKIAETRQTVQKAINELPENQKEIIELKYFWELSLEEVAQTLKTPLGTIKGRLTAARKRLVELLDQDSTDEKLS